jgi:DNA-binding NarL/FixJ family response regulator
VTGGTSPPQIGVLVVDDQSLIRSAVRALVAHEPDLLVVGEATDGRSAVRAARESRPDVIVMDIRMPGMDGIAATREICADPALAGVRVLVLTTFEEEDYVVEALRAGAGGFLGKGAQPGELAAAIRTVHRGEALLSPAATSALIRRSISVGPRGAPDAAVADALTTLTERERDVLTLVGRGRSNEEIAAELSLSPLTVKTHVNRAMTKLAAHDRAQLVIIAYEHGLVVPGAPA